MVAKLRFLKVAGALLAVLAVSACGGGGGGGETPAPPKDITAPTIVSAQAVSGSVTYDLLTPGMLNVPINSVISVRVNERLACPTTQPTVGTFGSVTGSVTCLDTLLTLVPSALFAYGTRYDLGVSFSDLAGNAGAPFATWFMTASAPPPVDTTPPTLLSVSVASGATVPVALPSVTYTFSEDVACKGQVGMTSPGYTVVGTTTCSGKTLTFTPTSQAFYATAHTLTLPQGVVADGAGNLLATADVRTVTTEKLAGSGTRLLVANGLGNVAGGFAPDGTASIIDTASLTVTDRVLFAPAPGHFGADRVDADSGTGEVLFASNSGTYVIHRMKTDGTVLASFPIDSAQPSKAQGVRGLAHSDVDRCAVLGILASQDSYYRANVLQCRSRTGTEVTFESATNFVAPAGMIVTKLLGSGTKYYAVAGTTASFNLNEYAPVGVGARLGFGPGQGLVTEIDAVTHTVTRTFSVGQAPNDAVIRGNHLLVVNAYDRSLSDVDLTTGVVTTTDLRAHYGEYEHPMSIATDGTYDYIGDYLLAVRVMQAGQEIARIAIGGDTGRMTAVGGRLYVAMRNGDFRLPFVSLNAVAVIDLASRTLVQTIAPVGAKPVEITAY